MERREKGVIAVLLVVLLLAVVLMVVGSQRSESFDQVGSFDGLDSSGLSASGFDTSGSSSLGGRPLDRSEISGACLSRVNGQVGMGPGGCTVAVASTDVPHWSVPVIERWLPREMRHLDLVLSSPTCSADLEFRTGEIEYRDVELDAETMRASLAVQAEGGQLRVRRLRPLNADCRLNVELDG